eukprot:gnl/TRDRNA2_/TRDRNA2_143964_c1_seq1.p1 gnl/TRDRNA2_/TRDRNA2_143964_c1~~gnl/TRDRNA2_/TRDRNA2_143964_c1_seq1.p1  ORF type:complete len:196 (+),score=68.22 gnl/TRDRNA2_/TRDRNA2_143964_c1_seq1:113-700(+)
MGFAISHMREVDKTIDWLLAKDKAKAEKIAAETRANAENAARAALEQHGGLEAIIALAKSGTDVQKKGAAGDLLMLAYSSDLDRRVAIVKAGAVEPLKALEESGFSGAILALHHLKDAEAIVAAEMTDPEKGNEGKPATAKADTERAGEALADEAAAEKVLKAAVGKAAAAAAEKAAKAAADFGFSVPPALPERR